MPDPKERHSHPSKNGQNTLTSSKRGYESQAQGTLHGTRVVAQKPKPTSGTEGKSEVPSPEATLVEKLIAFFKEMD